MQYLYGSIVIPPEVAAELASQRRPEEVRNFIGAAPAWLAIRSPIHWESIEGIDRGEIAAICLARELNAEILLIDETRGRAAAIARNIRTLRTTAMLLDAANAGVVVDLEEVFKKLKATNFRVRAETLEGLLIHHRKFIADKAIPPIP